MICIVRVHKVIILYYECVLTNPDIVFWGHFTLPGLGAVCERLQWLMFPKEIR